MSERINCKGCCWWTVRGVVEYRCDQTVCPFWGYFFGRNQPKVNTGFS